MGRRAARLAFGRKTKSRPCPAPRPAAPPPGFPYWALYGGSPLHHPWVKLSAKDNSTQRSPHNERYITTKDELT